MDITTRQIATAATMEQLNEILSLTVKLDAVISEITREYDIDSYIESIANCETLCNVVTLKLSVFNEIARRNHA